MRLAFFRLLLGLDTLFHRFAKWAGMVAIEGIAQTFHDGAFLHGIGHRHANPGG
jgi:hypothetical protein